MSRQGHVTSLLGTLLIGCTVLLLVGCAGVGSDASQKQQGGAEATKKEQTRSPEATASEEAQCERTRTYDFQTKDPTIVLVFTTNDLPGCPKGGLLSGTDKRDLLDGKDGEDKIRGLGGSDNLYGGSGNDILYGGPDADYELFGGTGDDELHGGAGVDYLSGTDEGKDVLYGGDGNDVLFADGDGGQDELYCGEGWDRYYSDKNDYVESSCEKDEGSWVNRSHEMSGDDVAPVETILPTTSATSSAWASPVPVPQSGGPAILLLAAALLLGSGILTYAILRRR